MGAERGIAAAEADDAQGRFKAALGASEAERERFRAEIEALAGEAEPTEIKADNCGCD